MKREPFDHRPSDPAEERRGLMYYLRRALGILRGRIVLRRAHLGRRIAVMGPLDVSLSGTCRIGDLTTFRGGMVPTVIEVRSPATLSIGGKCVFNYGVHIDVSQGVEIGDGCMFGSMACISDREGDRIAPISIGDGVWIAHGAQIRPGVQIGDGAVVAAGSVVSSDVPPGFIAVGNPAKHAPLTLIGNGPPAPPDPSRPPAVGAAVAP